jgi:hypothetical protein
MSESKFFEELSTPLGTTTATVFSNWEMVKEMSFMTNDNSVVIRNFVIKVTGRYIIDHQCNLIDTINNYNINGIDCIIKYGSHNDETVVNRSNDCITGLIGMKVGYIKQINTNVTDECIEWEWANVANKIPDDRIIMLDEIGIHVIGLHQPGDNVKSKK